MNPPSILVVDDEPTVGFVIRQTLEQHDCDVVGAESAEAAQEVLQGRSFDVALLDIVLPGASGLELLAEIKKTSPTTEVVMMTSQSSLDSAIQAIRDGAYDYLRKPFDDIDDVWISVERALDRCQLTRSNRALVDALVEQNSDLADNIQRLGALLETSHAVGQIQSLEELFQRFVDIASRELDVERLSVMLLDESAGQLLIAAHRGLDDLDDLEIRNVRVPLGEGIAGRVARDGEAVLVQDVEADGRVSGDGKPDLATSFISAPIVLSVPIISHSQVLGVLNVTNRRSNRPFLPPDLEYVQGLTSQLAVAIESSRRFEDLQTAYESLRKTQDQLLMSERLKAFGQMAAGVAHDFNNALAVILGRAEICLMRLDEAEEIDRAELRSNLEAVTNVSLQAAEMVKRVQDFTRIRKDTPRGQVHLDQVVRDAVEMTRPKWQNEAVSHGHDVQMALDLQEVPPIRGNRNELAQVLNNLIFNAVDAMPEGGVMRFEAHDAGDLVGLKISDDGIGMDEEARKHVFDPFYTTKEAGNGLGMSIVFGIVERHGGKISVESTPGEGTTFRLEFPIAQEPAEPTASAPGATEPELEARILLVDDDEDLRETILDTLEAHGHRVTAAPSGAAALVAFEQDRFDLAITDFSMPGMSGIELAQKLHDKAPDLPVILLSGWAVQAEEEQIRRAGIDWTLPKPCPSAELRQTIHAALQSRGPELSSGSPPDDDVARPRQTEVERP